MQLLLDNAPSHPRDSTLMSNNSLITVTFRPHVKALIQLMDKIDYIHGMTLQG